MCTCYRQIFDTPFIPSIQEYMLPIKQLKYFKTTNLVDKGLSAQCIDKFFKVFCKLIKSRFVVKLRYIEIFRSEEK